MALCRDNLKRDFFHRKNGDCQVPLIASMKLVYSNDFIVAWWYHSHTRKSRTNLSHLYDARIILLADATQKWKMI